MKITKQWELSAKIPRKGDKRWSKLTHIWVPLERLQLIPFALKQFRHFTNLKKLTFEVVQDKTKWNEKLLSELYMLFIKKEGSYDIDLRWIYRSHFERKGNKYNSFARLGYLLGMIARTVNKFFRAFIDRSANKIFMKNFLTASDFISRKKSFKGPYIYLGASYRSPVEMSERYKKYLTEDICLGQFKWD